MASDRATGGWAGGPILASVMSNRSCAPFIAFFAMRGRYNKIGGVQGLGKQNPSRKMGTPEPALSLSKGLAFETRVCGPNHGDHSKPRRVCPRPGGTLG